MRHSRYTFPSMLLLLSCLVLLAACNTIYKTNSLGYGFAYDQMSSPTPKSVVYPTVTPQARPDPLLTKGGLGNTLDTFFAKYSPLLISHPPTHYAFQQSLDLWPGGSILFAEFENGTQDASPRAVQFSLVPGTNHPTTYEQAQAFAQSLLPSDRKGPVTVQALDTGKGQCLTMVWNSADLAKIFPPEDFLGGTNGKLGKPGDVVVSFFPHFTPAGLDPDQPASEAFTGDEAIDDPNIVGSLLIALGDRPSC